LAAALLQNGAVAASHPRDAFHIAIAAVHGVQYLLAWNFKHIANRILQNTIASVCRANGFEPPVICTPEQLLEAERDSESKPSRDDHPLLFRQDRSTAESRRPSDEP
jgi:hypothetical protein